MEHDIRSYLKVPTTKYSTRRKTKIPVLQVNQISVISRIGALY
jgi:hypothetical protein